MYLYGPGEAVSEKYRDGLILNIFNWHTTWTVEVQEDNAGWVTLPSDSNLRYEMDRRAYDSCSATPNPSTSDGRTPNPRTTTCSTTNPRRSLGERSR